MQPTTRSHADAAALRRRNEARCERLLDRSALLDTDGIAWSMIAATEVDPAVLECLVYMRDVEGFTTRYLEGFAGHSATMADPLVHRFLEVWQAEEGAHAQALDRFLLSYASGRGITLPTMQAPPPPRPPLLERLLVRLSSPLGHVVTAAHMAWGATNELLTLNGYRLLADRCGHPQLAELLGRIAAQESRHYGFYYLQSEWRLAASRTARAVVPRLLARTWTPVGVGDGFKTPDEFDRVLVDLTDCTAGLERIESMDRTVQRLPGCGELTLFRSAASASHRRVPARPLASIEDPRSFREPVAA